MIISASPIPASLSAQWLRQDEDAMIRVRQPAYIDENLFFEYILQVLISYISNLREKPEFANDGAGWKKLGGRMITTQKTPAIRDH
jgi:hypothetical protein